MPYNESSYKGDSEYTIDATGDCAVGDEVRFERATFSGSFRKPKFAGFEMVTGKIVNDSYGDLKQQHTFTIQFADGAKTTIKGRNLYRNGVWRKPWADEPARENALAEKHARGDEAREQREDRRKIENENLELYGDRHPF